MSPPAAVANILFAGPCNLRCPLCIGRVLGRRGPTNLDLFPLPGLDRFCAAVRQRGIRDVSLSGTDTDPQLYRHEARLLDLLRAALPGVRLSLHTNGLLALARASSLDRYDRVTVSVPSFRPATAARLTGWPMAVDLAALLARTRVPVKVSVLVTAANRAELPEILDHCRTLGIRRVALRRPFQEAGPGWDPLPGQRPVRTFAGNPVHELDGLEVTAWDFRRTTLPSLDLLADGSLREEYLLVDPALRLAS